MNKLNDLKTKYFSLSVAVRAGLWFTICNLLQKGIAMITMPIFTRILTTEQYGVFTVYQSWYNIVSIIVTLNLAGSVINNGMVKYENKRNEFISSMQSLSITVTIAFFIIYLCFMDFFNGLFNLSGIFILTMFVQLLFEPAYLMWAQRQRYEYKYKSLIAMTAIISITSPVLGVVAVLSTDYKAEARVISYALVQICIGLVFFILQSIKGKTFFNKEYWKFALAFNLPLIPHYLSQIVLGQADRIMIERMIGASEAAMYGVTYNLATVITLFINAINSSFIPTFYESLKAKKYESIRKTSTFLCLFMAVLICAFTLFGPELLAIFASKEYGEAKWIFPPVAASVFFTFIFTLFINAEFYFEKTKYVMFVSIIGAILNIVLNMIFIKRFGYIAAGYTTVVCYILFSLGHFFLYKMIIKKQGITENFFEGKKIFFIGIAVSTFMLICLVLYSHNIIRYIAIAVIIILALINYKRLIQIIRKAVGK